MICRKWGHENAEDAVFCGQCGTKLIVDTSTETMEVKSGAQIETTFVAEPLLLNYSCSRFGYIHIQRGDVCTNYSIYRLGRRIG